MFTQCINPYFGYKIIKVNDIRQIKRHRQKRLNKKLNKKYGIKTRWFLPHDKIMMDTINNNVYVPASIYSNFIEEISRLV